MTMMDALSIFGTRNGHICINPGACNSVSSSVRVALHLNAMFLNRFMDLVNSIHNKSSNLVATLPGRRALTGTLAIVRPH